MAGLPLRVSRFSVSLISNVFLKANITRHVGRLDLTLTCAHNRNTSFISPYISKRYYALNSNSRRTSIIGQFQNVKGNDEETSTLSSEGLDLRKRLEEERAKDEEEKQKESARRSKITSVAFMFSGVFIFGGACWMLYMLGSPPKDEEGNLITDEFSDLPQPQQAFYRIKNNINTVHRFVVEPARENLLPDPLTYPYIQPPYTVVLDFSGLLVHPDWTLKTGWRFKKRPYVDNFLEQIAPPLFEVVLYSTESAPTIFPILDELDKNGYIMYRLGRESARYVDGSYVKCLDHLNRDLSKVIVVEWNPKSIKDNHRNVLFLPEWTGNDDDTALIDLGALLKTIALSKVEDVREVLDYYQQFDDPIGAFRENQRKLLEQLEQREKERKTSSEGLAQQWKPTFVKR